jgi:hypothetical protein
MKTQIHPRSNETLSKPSLFKIYEQLDHALEDASEARRAIFTELKLKPWFMRTSCLFAKDRPPVRRKIGHPWPACG